VKSIKKISILMSVAFILIFLAVFFNEKAFNVVIKYVPDNIRSEYIEYVFEDSEGDKGSEHLKVMLLRSLLEQPYDFDPKVLFQLCKRGEGEHSEPIPKLATRLIIKQFPHLIEQLILYYENDVLTQELLISQIKKEESNITGRQYKG